MALGDGVWRDTGDVGDVVTSFIHSWKLPRLSNTLWTVSSNSDIWSLRFREPATPSISTKSVNQRVPFATKISLTLHSTTKHIFTDRHVCLSITSLCTKSKQNKRTLFTRTYWNTFKTRNIYFFNSHFKLLLLLQMIITLVDMCCNLTTLDWCFIFMFFDCTDKK